MAPKDKYTVFTRHERGYRKGIHKVPKWTRVRRAFSCRRSVPLTASLPAHASDQSQRLLTGPRVFSSRMCHITIMQLHT